MSNTSDTKRLAEAVANIATTITEIIELKIRELTEATKAAEPVHGGINMLSRADGWVGKKEAAEHLKIGQSTLSNWIRKELIPYVRLGRSVRFKLSQVDEAMNRRLRGMGGY